MKHRSFIFCLAIVGTALLCLALAGCAPAPEQQGDEKTAEGAATSDTGAAKSATAVKKAAPAPRRATIPVGTPITVVTSATLSTKTNKSGDAFQASLAEDIADGSYVVAKRGALVTGVISDSDPGGRVKGVASITIKLDTLALADGREASIATDTHTVVAKSTKKKDATKVGIGAGVGAAIGAIAGGGKGAAIGAAVGGAAGAGTALATHGDPAEIPSETSITFELAAPLEVVEQK